MIFRYGTIGSLQGGENDSSSDEEKQAFYTGGSEHGGWECLFICFVYNISQVRKLNWCLNNNK